MRAGTVAIDRAAPIGRPIVGAWTPRAQPRLVIGSRAWEPHHRLLWSSALVGVLDWELACADAIALPKPCGPWPGLEN